MCRGKEILKDGECIREKKKERCESGRGGGREEIRGCSFEGGRVRGIKGVA